MLRYDEARANVIALVEAQRRLPPSETVPLEQALGRVLAEPVIADRDYPPFHRATRDGFALRAPDLASLPATLKQVGEIKAGESFSGIVGEGECAQIMTGAPLPMGADAVLMLEYAEAKGNQVTVKRAVRAGENVVRQGSEARKGIALLEPGRRIGYVEISLLGQVGRAQVQVYRRPRVAILSTGDEVVDIAAQPGPVQIRNSNSFSLAAQIRLSGGEPLLLGNAPDTVEILREKIERGLQEDLLVLSGGVSMGKHDLVEVVLRQLGGEFYFDAVGIQPGRPAVFGRCRDKFVFGLPGNPVSTMVTFELFVAPALALLGGSRPRPLRFLKARLAETVRTKTGLTRFLPGRLEGDGGEVTAHLLPWQGSGDVVTLAASDCFLVVPEDRAELPAGEYVDVLLRLGS
ncbi:MAG: molybdopterin molybdotransferase MoeA [Acidobacteria bacterium]|nr:molybdopterin molybdotransferase MoeA [Acidobacteriota bacterium]